MPTDESEKPRLVLLGSDSAFSGIVLRTLLDADVDVAGVVLRDSHPPTKAFEPRGREIPVVVANTGPAVAVEYDVPVIHARSAADEQAVGHVGELEPDYLLVACFPMILSQTWLSLPREECINVHPSLLPSYRGPTPLFWQLREGERETGVTLHVVETALDAGDIVAQQSIPLPAGARFSEVNANLARLGAELMVDMLVRLGTGVGVPRTAQDEALASYQPFPKGTDFRFDTHFSAERAYRFMEGVKEWGIPFEVDVGDRVFVLNHALDFHHDTRMATPFELEGSRIRIRFSDGILEAVGHPAD